jgi:hypothetical protein
MNKLSRASEPERNFTEKQGQYLAFIWAYTRVLGRPPPRLTCSATSR